MGYTKSKTIFLNEREREANKNVQAFHQELEAFFGSSKRVVLDVRIRKTLDTNVVDNAHVPSLKAKIRKDMLKEFRKELNLQLREQIG